MELTADSAVRAAERQLRRELPHLVARLLWYGAVDLSPRNLVVWVLLQGAPDDLPAWFFPSDDVERDMHATGGRLDELRAAVSVVRTAFADAGWPDAAEVNVGFDSDQRVEQAGGWRYFQ